MQFTTIENGLSFELSAHAGRVMTYDRLLERVWGLRSSGDSRRVRLGCVQCKHAPIRSLCLSLYVLWTRD